MRKLILLSSLILFAFIGITQDISKDEVIKVASYFLNADSKTKSDNDQNLKLIDFSKNDTSLVYLVHDNRNFVLFANDLRVNPILGYSTESSFDGENYPPQFLEILDSYKDEIIQVKRGVINVKSSYKSIWNNYLAGDYSRSKATVSPIIDVNWDQGAGWNRFCPEDTDGPAGKVYVGCVAVAMAQAMSVYEYPDHGYDSVKYATTDYGILNVNFENTNYEWDKMQSNAADDYNSLLLYHCAVAVSMQFGPDGSGAYTSDVPEALKKYYDYSPDTRFSYSTDDEAWSEKLKQELDNGRPIIYSGNDGSGTGHAFNIDGYSENDYFHVNWGWSGAYNGNYKLDVLTPGTHDFSYNNGAVYFIAPMDHSSTDILLSEESFRENCEVGFVISLITTVDPDENEQFIYEVKGTDGPGGNTTYCPFYTDGDSLKLAEKVSYEDYNKLYFTITSEDMNHDVIEKDFTIDVLKENYIPTNINIDQAEFYDTISNGSFIGKFSTTDPDEIDTFTYVFEINPDPNLSKDNNKFIISNDSLFTNYDFNNYSENECFIYVKSSDWKGESVTKEFVLSVNITTGNVTIIQTEEKIKLYPNPTSNYITISAQQEKIELIKIYNIVGNIQDVIKGNNENTTIDLSDYKSGIYIVSIELYNGQKNTYKILKRD